MSYIKDTSKEVGFTLLGTIFVATPPIILIPILTRAIPPSEYGELALVMQLAVLLGSFINFGFVAAFRNDLLKVISTNLLVPLLLVFLGVVACGFIYLLFCDIFFNDLDYFWLSISIAITTVLCSLVFVWFQSLSKYNGYLSFCFIYAVFHILFCVVLLHYIPGFEARVYGFLIANIFVWLFFSMCEYRSFEFDVNIDLIKRNFFYALPVGASLIMQTLMQTASKYSMSESLEDLAIFTVTLQLIAPLKILSASFNRVFKKIYYQLMSNDQATSARNLTGLSVILFFIICVFFGLLFPIFFNIFVSEAYAYDALLTWLIICSFFVAFCLQAVNKSFFYAEKTIVMFLSRIPALISSLFVFSFYIDYGYYVVAIGMVSYYLVSIIGMFFIKKVWLDA